MFGYTLKISDIIAVLIVGGLLGAIFVAQADKTPYNWDWSVLADYIIYRDEAGDVRFNLLAHGILNTMRLFVYTTVLAVPIALMLAFVRLSQNPVFSTVAMLYINFVRNIPVLVFLFVFYFFVSEQIFPLLGLSRDIFSDTGIRYILFGEPTVAPNVVAGFICLGLFESVFFAEIIRGSIQSIPHGQFEASYAMGLSKIKTYAFVIVPQAFKKSAPPLAGQTIIVLKNTSIVSIVSIQDLMFSASEIVVSTHRIFEVWIGVAGIYFIICYSLSRLFKVS